MIQRYGWDDSTEELMPSDNGFCVMYPAHLAEVAKLTEENERLRKVAEQAVQYGEIELSDEMVRTGTWVYKLSENDVPELYAYLKENENQNGE